MKSLTANAVIQISKPANEVFEAIVDPAKMSNYFIKNATARLVANTTVQWSFPEFPDSFPVQVKTVKANEYISFNWSGGGDDQLVEITLNNTTNNSTIVKVIEHSMPVTEEGIQQMKQQTEGWANFLACLKAYLEYGINLRKGAFDFMKPAE
ncbi:SRPBCC domain-containing protein [Gynurincola endophyticus]|uniref:SRPBCC domain-containing protein n=1 Tax=Gynurincola endophyticus TaxID=2479004 RepID=UPI000F8F550C|nr:SRPBCC domain-containing protein [Gynurincola endophyticus]